MDLRSPPPSPGDHAEGLPPPLSSEERRALREVARESIESGLEARRPLQVLTGSYSAALRAPGAAFVTLRISGKLRGCVGSLQARRPLVEDVSHNAFAAAFRDSRFPPLSRAELPELDLHISRLTPPVPLAAGSLGELLAALRPGVDGLLLEDPPFRATFLPQVWESLPSPGEFVSELLRKAGLRGDHWSETISWSRYRVEEL
jgi:hypothetical protein